MSGLFIDAREMYKEDSRRSTPDSQCNAFEISVDKETMVLHVVDIAEDHIRRDS